MTISNAPSLASTEATALAAQLAVLLRAEHHAMAEFLLALADFDRRRAWAELGHASLWAFLHRDLRLSAGAAYHRKAAAELLQRCPEVEAPLRDGRLCLSSVAELAKVLTPENQAGLLPRFFHRSAREAQALVAELAPRPVVPTRTVVTRLVRTGAMQSGFHTYEAAVAGGSSGRPPPEGAGPLQVTEPPLAPSLVPPHAAALVLAPSPKPASIVPLTADLRRLSLTVSRTFLEKVTAARTARGHARPGATVEAVLEEALDLLLAREARRREGAVKRPGQRARPAAPIAEDQADHAPSERLRAPRHVPAEVRREVWARDRGCCQWPVASGGVCGSTLRPELDHLVLWSRGGRPTVANLRILCRGHNQEAAKRAFGEKWLAKRRGQERVRGAERSEGEIPRSASPRRSTLLATDPSARPFQAP